MKMAHISAIDDTTPVREATGITPPGTVITLCDEPILDSDRTTVK
jgi:hypothetical protein